MNCPYLHVEEALVRYNFNPVSQYLQRLLRNYPPILAITQQTALVANEPSHVPLTVTSMSTTSVQPPITVPPVIDLEPPTKCISYGMITHTVRECQNKSMKCTNCGRLRHLYIACSFLVAVVTATLSPSQPFVRNSILIICQGWNALSGQRTGM
jgi:hypothetical protein